MALRWRNTLPLLLFALASVSEAQVFQDPASGHYYELVTVPGINWTSAKVAAEERTHNFVRGHLVCIESEAENSFLLQTFGELAVSQYWLGASEVGGFWQWVNGEPMVYTDWGPGEPNNVGGAEHYLMFWYPEGAGWGRSRWNDGPNNNTQFGYIVEYEAIGISIWDINGAAEVSSVIEPTVLRSNLNVGIQGFIDPRQRLQCRRQIRIQAAPNTDLRIYINPVAGTGGHAHSGTRRHGWLKPTDPGDSFPPYKGENSFIEGGEADQTDYDSGLEVRTNQAGEATVYYVSPEYSGIDRITVETVGTPASRIRESKDVFIGFSGFAQLFDSNSILRVGILAAHPSSHHGRPELVQALQALGAVYLAKVGSKLQVNDMSLTNGGYFDIHGTWLDPHVGHRTGREVDINLTPGNPEFESILAKQGWWINNASLWRSEGNHYHLNLSSSGSPTVILNLQLGQNGWTDLPNRIYSATVKYFSEGGLGGSVGLAVSATNGATVSGGNWNFDGAVGNSGQRTFQITVPQGVSSFKLMLNGSLNGVNGESRPVNEQIGINLGALLSGFTITPASIIGGSRGSGLVTLNQAVPEGAVVALSESSSVLFTPSSVAIPSNGLSAVFEVGTLNVTTATSRTVTASYGGVSLTRSVAIVPGPTVLAPQVSVTAVEGGTTFFAKFRLSGPAPSDGRTIQITSSSILSGVPLSYVFTSGNSSSPSFTVSTPQVTQKVKANIAASLLNQRLDASIDILPIAKAKTITAYPSTVVGGQSFYAKVTLTSVAPTGGARVQLTSGSGSIQVPPEIIVPAGQTQSPSFAVSTSGVNQPYTRFIYASRGGATVKTAINLIP